MRAGRRPGRARRGLQPGDRLDTPRARGPSRDRDRPGARGDPRGTRAARPGGGAGQGAGGVQDRRRGAPWGSRTGASTPCCSARSSSTSSIPGSCSDEARRVLRPGGRIVVTTPYGVHPYPDHKEPLYLSALLERALAEAVDRRDRADRPLRRGRGRADEGAGAASVAARAGGGGEPARRPGRDGGEAARAGAATCATAPGRSSARCRRRTSRSRRRRSSATPRGSARRTWSNG